MGLRNITLLLTLFALIGQYIFIIGLEQKSYNYCLFSRLVFGISDSQTIVQQIIMCMWFTPEQLPIAMSMLLFMVKVVRAVSDNSASLVYNSSGSITLFFWYGLWSCVASQVFCVILC